MGLGEQTLLTALAHAAAYTPPGKSKHRIPTVKGTQREQHVVGEDPDCRVRFPSLTISFPEDIMNAIKGLREEEAKPILEQAALVGEGQGSGGSRLTSLALLGSWSFSVWQCLFVLFFVLFLSISLLALSFSFQPFVS